VLSLLLSLHGLSSRPRPALGIAPGPAIVFLAPMKDEVVPGRFAALAMTLNLRVRIVAGFLVRALVGPRAAAAQRDSAAFPRAPVCHCRVA
jgi:hypothetical protein